MTLACFCSIEPQNKSGQFFFHSLSTVWGTAVLEKMNLVTFVSLDQPYSQLANIITIVSTNLFSVCLPSYPAMFSLLSSSQGYLWFRGQHVRRPPRVRQHLHTRRSGRSVSLLWRCGSSRGRLTPKLMRQLVPQSRRFAGRRLPESSDGVTAETPNRVRLRPQQRTVPNRLDAMCALLG
jgi:hypothetical protein